MDDRTARIEELVAEIKGLQAANAEAALQNSLLRGQLHAKNAQLAESLATIERLTRTSSNLKEELAIAHRRSEDRARQLQNEIRKSDVFRETYKGSSRTRRDEMVNRKMESLRKLNRTVLDFIGLLSGKFSFDKEICASLCEIADGTDDPIIQVFLAGLECARNARCDGLESEML